jgi:hypothetical protein
MSEADGVAGTPLSTGRTVADELLRHAQQLAAEGDHQVRAVANLRLLRLRRHHQQLRRRVRHLQLGADLKIESKTALRHEI